MTRLARQPGARESRWAHLLCGEVAADSARTGAPDDRDEVEVLRAEVDELRAELAALRAAIERLARELGLAAE